MKIEIAQHGRMSESGSSLLRLIQNQDMPLLDLLVRESIQNSLDASNGKPFVNVDFSVKPFEAKALNKHLDGITDQLNHRYACAPCTSIVVSDTHTVGLTGPVSYNEVKGHDFGNCLKLIYEISKPQLNEGAGGSWGLGKTIYFRIGMGLVLYYSRIRESNRYKSRLAACYVEDETKPGAILPASGGVKRGIAWWGDAPWNKKTTVPVHDEKEIARILSIFDVKPYVRDETGTTIIIPYIDEKKLLQEVYARNDEATQKPYWVSSLTDYLRVAVQRWYAPRLLNTEYEGAYLRASINQELIKVHSLLPLFRVIRELYICTKTGRLPEDALIAEAKAEYQIDEIRTREVFVLGTSVAGKLAYLKLTDKQLKMTPPDNQKTPYQQITNRVIPMESGNTPIVMYTRKPGMVVGYDFNGVWTHRMPRSGENEYIIGLFVANSSNRLIGISDATGHPLTLEEYIRQGEKADHASWADRTINGLNPRVISKVQNGIIRNISAKYKEKPVTTVERKNTGLSHALADLLLPGSGFGRRATGGDSGGNSGSGGSSGNGGSGNKPSITLTSAPVFNNGHILCSFEASVRKGHSDLLLSIVTDYKKYAVDSWESEDEIARPFPVSFAGMTISNRRKPEKNGRWEIFPVALSAYSVSCDDLQLDYLGSAHFGTRSGIRISSGTDWKIKGQLDIVTTDPDLKVTVDIRGVQE